MRQVDVRRNDRDWPGDLQGEERQAILLATTEVASLAGSQRLARVHLFVLENFDGPIKLIDAAGVAEMERTSFSRFFHRETGLRFRDWLAAVRVVKAVELMSEDHMPIREIGAKVGYPNVRSFHRVFLQIAGRPPGEYRDLVRNP